MKSFSLFKQPSDIKLEIAERFKALRKVNGFTQVDLADRAGVSLGSLKRFEQQGEISLHHLLLLSQILDVLNEFDKLFVKKEEISEKVRKALEDNE